MATIVPRRPGQLHRRSSNTADSPQNWHEIMNKYNTLRWGEHALDMLDQRLLPARIEYVRYDSAAAVAAGIKTMVVRGAPAIGCAAAYGVALEALRLRDQPRDAFLAGLTHGIAALAASRPTAVNLFWALDRMRARLDTLSLRALPVAEIADALLAEAHAITVEDVQLNRAMGTLGAALLPHNARVLTHCNAGSLATAGHGTALGVIRSAVEAGKHVFLDKPIANNVSDGRAITEVCKKAGVVLALGYQRRRESHFRYVKKQIDAGAFGRLVNAEANISRDRLGQFDAGSWRYTAEGMPGGVMLQIGIHYADVLEYLMGPVKGGR